jgi:pyrroloquinoline quinone biosynthesis protein D
MTTTNLPPADTSAAPAAPSAPVPVAIPAYPLLSRLYRLQYEPVQLAWVLLYPEGMVKLNDSAAEILRRCNGKFSPGGIVVELEALFNTKGIAPQVQAMLEEGVRRGWIV